MLQVNNVTGEEQSQYIANLTSQNQDLKTKLESVTTQLSQLQVVLQNFTAANDGNQDNNNQHCTNHSRKNRLISHYCWTYGANNAHNSSNDSFPREGHV